MKAIMLAAGIGRRLSGGNNEHPPKVLLDFGRRSLLQRHLDALRLLGVEGLTLVVGYRSHEILKALDDMGAGAFVRTVENNDFLRGTALSLWTARDTLTGGGDVLFMDADVLYHPTVLQRLIEADGNRLLYDARLEADEEPVKICLRGGRPVEFGKKVSGTFDAMGEWVGFMKLSQDYAARFAQILESFMDGGRHDEPMEEAVRELLIASPAGAFDIVDVSDLPWIEIDFPEDLARARDVILPEIERIGS